MALTKTSTSVIATGGVHTSNIADNSITSLKLVDNSVGVDAINSDIRAVQYIGIDTGDYIEFAADTKIDFFINALNKMRLEADGDLQVAGDVIAASTAFSDKRLKDNIKPIKNSLEAVKMLNGVTYDWKATGKSSVGVIAQNIQEVFPELVKEVQPIGEDEKRLTVNYNGLVGVLIEAVKDLSKQVEELKK